MTTEYRDTFTERLEAIGEARGAARMLLRLLKARGLQLPDSIRERIAACTDLDQLDAWADRAATADSITDFFSDSRRPDHRRPA